MAGLKPRPFKAKCVRTYRLVRGEEDVMLAGFGGGGWGGKCVGVGEDGGVWQGG